MTAPDPQIDTQPDPTTNHDTRQNPMRITVSGKTYNAAIADSQVPTEEHWPAPTATRAGRGWRYTYDVEPNVGRLIETHLEDVESALTGGLPETGADVRAIRRDLDRMADR